jgi:hypothetical protein
LSFVAHSIHMWTPPFLFWMFIGSFVAQLALWFAIRAKRRS